MQLFFGKVLRKDLSRLDDWFKGKWKKDKKRKKEEPRKKNTIKVESFKVAIEKLKQRISAKSEKLRQCLTPDNQYRQTFPI